MGRGAKNKPTGEILTIDPKRGACGEMGLAIKSRCVGRYRNPSGSRADRIGEGAGGRLKIWEVRVVERPRIEIVPGIGVAGAQPEASRHIGAPRAPLICRPLPNAPGGHMALAVVGRVVGIHLDLRIGLIDCHRRLTRFIRIVWIGTDEVIGIGIGTGVCMGLIGVKIPHELPVRSVGVAVSPLLLSGVGASIQSIDNYMGLLDDIVNSS